MWAIYFLCFLLLSVIIDGEHINKGQFIESHTTRWFLRGVVIIGLSPSILGFIAMIVFWMAWFDGLLNFERDLDFFYIGDTAEWDKFWGKRPRLYVSFKVVTMILSILLIGIAVI